jgi:hypothetical protein
MIKGDVPGGNMTSAEDISVGRSRDGTLLLTWIETQSATIPGGMPFRMRHSVKLDVNDALWLKDELARTLREMS